ncbi:MAG: BrnT family toxin [Nostoc sp.]|uniref:BrnT family toxin n=1 Tax=Nostoc sp. TaxID=1180 RepID=UPI002FF79019
MNPKTKLSIGFSTFICGTFDCNRISLDDRQDYGEDRLIGLGMLDGRIVVVVFTELDEETIRIISLRKALPYERKRYEQYLKNELGES